MWTGFLQSSAPKFWSRDGNSFKIVLTFNKKNHNETVPVSITYTKVNISFAITKTKPGRQTPLIKISVHSLLDLLDRLIIE